MAGLHNVRMQIHSPPTRPFFVNMALTVRHAAMMGVLLRTRKGQSSSTAWSSVTCCCGPSPSAESATTLGTTNSSRSCHAAGWGSCCRARSAPLPCPIASEFPAVLPHDGSTANGRQRRLCRQQFERPTGNCWSKPTDRRSELAPGCRSSKAPCPAAMSGAAVSAARTDEHPKSPARPAPAANFS